MLRTPSGMPLLWASSARASAVRGVASAGLRTTCMAHMINWLQKHIIISLHWNSSLWTCRKWCDHDTPGQFHRLNSPTSFCKDEQSGTARSMTGDSSHRKNVEFVKVLGYTYCFVRDSPRFSPSLTILPRSQRQVLHRKEHSLQALSAMDQVNVLFQGVSRFQVKLFSYLDQLHCYGKSKSNDESNLHRREDISLWDFSPPCHVLNSVGEISDFLAISNSPGRNYRR